MKQWGMIPQPIGTVVLRKIPKPTPPPVTNSVGIVLAEAYQLINEAQGKEEYDTEIHVIYVLDWHQYVLLDSRKENDAILIKYLKSKGTVPKPLPDGSIVDSHVMWSISLELCDAKTIMPADEFCYMTKFSDYNGIIENF